MKRKIRVLLCDDHAVVRKNVRLAINGLPGYEVVGEAETGSIGVRMATDLAVDLVMMDISMPELDGISATRKIVAKAPGIKILMFSTSTDEKSVTDALSAGASGYLLKEAGLDEISDALHSIMSGERYLSRDLPSSDAMLAPARGEFAPVHISSSARVVLVDDSAVVRERVAAALSASGNIEIVGQANDVPEGLKLIRETRPDLLILDIGLPGESGLSLLEIAKREGLVPCVMMLTNQDHPRLRQHCAELGADHYFHKPTEFERMIDLCFKLASLSGEPELQPVEVARVDVEKHHIKIADLEESRTAELTRVNASLRKEIGERQRVEHALRESQERYRQFVQMSTEGVARYEADAPLSIRLPELEQVGFILEHARVVECNDAFARQLGYAQATDAVGLRLLDCMAGTSEEKFQLVQQFVRSGYRLADLEAPDKHRSGQVIWTRSSFAGVVENDHLVRAWVIQQDITQRRQIEEAIREQAQMLDLAHDTIIIRDLEDRIQFWNESAQRLFGWTAEEVIGRRFTDILPNDVTGSVEVRDTIYSKDEWSGEVRLRRRDGTELVVESRQTLVRDRSGEPKSILAISADITERKKLETQFIRSQRMESIGMLAGGIAHDLNNVLAPIIMSSQLLEMDAVDPEQRKLLGIITTSAKRGADLVKQVLTFYRGDQGERQEIAPQYLIKELRHIISETFPKSVRAETKSAKNLWSVSGDPTQLHQVLLNLCVNARDAMPEGGCLTIEAQNVRLPGPAEGVTGKTESNPHVLISVGDTGTGIPTEIREKIFDPFFTTKAPGKGTGLGLPTSLAIIKSHGGCIEVLSEVGQGSVFKIYLPALENAPTASAQTEHFQIPRGNGETVLVVDDEASVRMIMAQTLQTFGYRTITANDGAEAIAIYEKRSKEIAVVLVDMMMPVMDGSTTIRKLAGINPHLKVIAASGMNTDGTLPAATGDCVKAFLPKPYTAGTLLKTLREILNLGGELKGDVVVAATGKIPDGETAS